MDLDAIGIVRCSLEVEAGFQQAQPDVKLFTCQVVLEPVWKLTNLQFSHAVQIHQVRHRVGNLNEIGLL